MKIIYSLPLNIFSKENKSHLLHTPTCRYSSQHNCELKLRVCVKFMWTDKSAVNNTVLGGVNTQTHSFTHSQQCGLVSLKTSDLNKAIWSYFYSSNLQTISDSEFVLDLCVKLSGTVLYSKICWEILVAAA